MDSRGVSWSDEDYQFWKLVEGVLLVLVMQGKWRTKERGLCRPGEQSDQRNCHDLHDVVCDHLDLLVLMLVLENVVAWLQNLGD